VEGLIAAWIVPHSRGEAARRRIGVVATLASTGFGGRVSRPVCWSRGASYAGNASHSVTGNDARGGEPGRIDLSGTQAWGRLPMLQHQRGAWPERCLLHLRLSRLASPSAYDDQALWRAGDFLGRNHIRFEPGVNEDLATTSSWGGQHLNLFPGAKRRPHEGKR
jgi:hypothetical protein